MNNSQESVLVLSLVATGYHWLYQRELASQERYAQARGYHYECVFGPLLHRFGGEIVWYKMHLIQQALLQGYSWVVFLDADAAVTEICPPIESVERSAKSIYMARGYSGRYNSGVMIYKNNRTSMAFVTRVIASRGETLSADDSVGWGENGHVIALARHHPAVQELASRWNNNQDPTMKDFVRHYSAGPLRALHKASRFSKWQFNIVNVLNRLTRRLLPSIPLLEQAQCMERWALSHFTKRNLGQVNRFAVSDTKVWKNGC